MSDDVMKMETHNDVLFFLAGCPCDFESIVNMYFSDNNKSNIDADGYAYDKGVFYKFGVGDYGSLWKQPLVNNDATGSGATFALAAMDFGLNVEQAVEYAATRDIYTGGKVNVFKAKQLNGIKA